MNWDTLVIGSGPGGLTSAVALARAGQKVLVLEQHYLPGGWTHSFSLGGYRFSPGVHYIGDLHPGGGVRRLYEGLGLTRDLEFLELNPEGFDHLIIAGERFDQPKGHERWKQRLTTRFPHERAGIDRYFTTLHDVVKDLQKCDTMLTFPRVLTVPFKAPSLIRWGFRTLGALLDGCIQDPMLKAVLSAQSGNHGLPPSRVSLPAHAAMSAHYDEGGFYPRGGAKSIPRAYIRELRRRGGTIRMRTREKILEAAENVIPSLRKHVKFLEVGTPLTNDFYCETYRGASYGTAKTPWQLGPFSFDQRGPVKGLHFCGASTLSHGVGGASLSGLFAAQHVLEREKADDLLGPPDGSLRIYPADRPGEWLVPSAEESGDEIADERRPREALLL